MVHKFNEYFDNDNIDRDVDNLVSLDGILYLVTFMKSSEYQFIPKTMDERDKVYGDLMKSVADIEKLLRGKTGMIWSFDPEHDAAGLVFKNNNYTKDMVTMVVH